MAARLLIAAGIGFVAGLLSGAFGIGGGVVTTPGIRLLLGVPPLVAVGTPLPAILPSAVTGGIQYARAKIADVRSAVIIGLSGSATAVVGAWATKLVGGTVVLLVTAAVILVTAVDMLAQAIRPPRPEFEAAEEASAFAAEAGVSRPDPRSRPAPWKLVAAGAATGLYSGFLGLGGGFILVPLLTRALRFPIKAAIGTSLIAIAILSVPGTITHALLGHIDWLLAFALTIGVIPGAWIGSRLTIGAPERAVRIGFAVMLTVVGVWLAVSEIARIAR